ncbi:tRNA (adenosine(37)-N6)-threonylcarbamoyltransferase complex ATPase subunit type 1 TsaE [Eubacteriales bacterium OttesenSCG-928-G02]|nr:tRNA (adenosine(37)-N6)-threonylcarbamoyltransferase complex ATPase subunit type 1 TsaE [Eubacteriales bacterium OttesenSCG-928-G02]
MKKQYKINNLAETELLAASLAEEIQKRRFVCLYGGLGSGKTTFTKYIVKALIPECLPLVHSPTFAIVNEYLGEKDNIFHFDLYRIKDEEELYATGFYDYEDRNGILILEWPENIKEIVPENAIHIRIETANDERIFYLEVDE